MTLSEKSDEDECGAGGNLGVLEWTEGFQGSLKDFQELMMESLRSLRETLVSEVFQECDYHHRRREGQRNENLGDDKNINKTRPEYKHLTSPESFISCS